jgi:hypothetical protein
MFSNAHFVKLCEEKKAIESCGGPHIPLEVSRIFNKFIEITKELILRASTMINSQFVGECFYGY